MYRELHGGALVLHLLLSRETFAQITAGIMHIIQWIRLDSLKTQDLRNKLPCIFSSVLSKRSSDNSRFYRSFYFPLLIKIILKFNYILKYKLTANQIKRANWEVTVIR